MTNAEIKELLDWFLPRKIKTFIQKIAGAAGVRLVRAERFKDLLKVEADASGILDLALSAIDVESQSKAQLKQDIFVLLKTNFKRNGFFVEFGATNGVDLSNTYLLEKSFNWKGILAEPAKIWHESLSQNRNVKIEHSCVWSESDKQLEFNMVDEPEFSTVSSFSNCDGHSEKRKHGSVYNVTTISLNDLLEKHEAPAEIDYLSVDTEGSEFEILSNFDFSKYNISIISCEHNYTDNRQKIYSLLTQYKYRRMFEGISKWDDWYVKDF